MGMNSVNIFDSLPKDLGLEVFENIIHASTIRIERIISNNQNESEWIMLVEGKAILEFDSGSKYELSVGDYINIPAHAKCKVV